MYASGKADFPDDAEITNSESTPVDPELTEKCHICTSKTVCIKDKDVACESETSEKTKMIPEEGKLVCMTEPIFEEELSAKSPPSPMIKFASHAVNTLEEDATVGGDNETA